MNLSLLRFQRPLVIVLGFILLFSFFYLLRGLLVPFALGFIFAYILVPFVQILESRQIPRSVAILISYVFFLGLIVLFVFYAIPLLLKDLDQLGNLIPRYVQFVQETLGQMQDGYTRIALPEGVRQVIDGTIIHVEEMVLGLIQGFSQGLVGFLGQSFNLILTPFISYYFLRDFNHLGEHLLKAVPLRYRSGVNQVGEEVNQVLRGFIKGSLLVAFWVGLLTTVGMYLIGMDFFVLIGIMVGVTNIIPYLGAIISAVPALLLALLKSKWLALYVLGLMILVHQLESNIISPRILSASVGLHPLVIMFALLAGGRLWGLGGLLLAVPLTAVFKVFVKHLYIWLV